MTKKEFISRQQAMTRAAKKPWFAIVWIGGFLGLIYAGTFIDDHKGNSWMSGIFLLLFFTFFATSFWLTIRFGKIQQQRFGMKCPGCNKQIVASNVHIAIATGNCGHCGEKVFDEPIGS